MENLQESGATVKEEKKCKSIVPIIIIILVLIILLLAGFIVWSVFFNKDKDNNTVVLTPDYAPQDVDDNAEPLDESGNTDKLDIPSGGGAVGLEYTKDVVINLKEKQAELYFANPARSTQDMVLQLVIQDEIVIQSGRLEPGHKVKKLDLLKNAEKKLKEGVYEGEFVVLFYEPGNGEKAILNTKIPIEIKVK